MNLFRKLILMSLTAAAFLAVMVERVTAQSNVVVIISDDDGWADYGFMRNADPAADPGNRGAIPTPHLDSVATMGVTFTNAYTGSVCSPSRAMITTGQYGMRFGYGSNILSTNGPIDSTSTPQGLPTEAITIWERMQGAGYDTSAVGKWHIGAHSGGGGSLGNRPQDQGVEFFQGLWAGSRSYFVGSETGDNQLRETISDGMGGITSNLVIEGNYSGQYVTDVFGDQSADYIKSKAGGANPFFLYSSFTAPHTPLQATAADLAFIDSLNDPGFTGNRRTFAAMQYAMDRNVGKILDALKDPAGDGTGAGNNGDSILDDTLIVFINDNGGDCCDVDPNSSDNGDLRNGKGSQFEGAMRVPMIIAGAGVNLAQHGTVSTDLVHSIDIVPTALVGAAGVNFAPGEVIDGKNLLPYINGTASGVAHENLFIPRYNNQQSAVRMGEWKYMYQPGTGYQLYNLTTDIDESNNVVAAPANASIVVEAHQLLASYHVQMDKPRHDNQAGLTNQFDHFLFREGDFATALFSTANAWTNGETNTGSFTATWRDGYANNVLTFRTKVTGDYSVTNDLNSVGGFSYMANKINLATGSNPLNSNHQATIGGLPVMLTKNRQGDLPEINLDATDATAKKFSFEIDHDIEIYDDLQIQGDGNQNFAINGQIREFRAGRNVTKTGTSELTLGGGVDITGNLDVQGGKVAFTNGQFRGNLISQPGTSLTVGGVGFNEVSGTPPSASIVTSGLNLNFDAMQNISGTSTWIDAQSGQSLSFGGAASTTPVSDGTYPGITAAYHIPSTGGAGGIANYFEGSNPLSRKDATFEVWFNVATTSGGGDQVLFEAGGSDLGVSFQLNDSDLSFNVNGVGTGSTTFSLSQTLGTGWHQAVGIIDLEGAGDYITLYVDNSFVGTLNSLAIDDWAGGNNTGIGATASSLGAGGTPIPYHDNIAAVRYYEGFAFGATEVNQNYQWAKFDPGVGATGPTLLAIDGDYTQSNGASLDLDLLDTSTHDAVSATGSATIDGILNVSEISGFVPAAGDSFTIFSAASGLSGRFDSVNLPALSGLQWLVDYSANAVTLKVILGADFDGSGVVDGRDFLQWQRGFGLSGQLDNSHGDADGNGVVDSQDLKIWQAQYGTTPGLLISSVSAVPEPSSGIATFFGSLLMTWFQVREASISR